MRSRLRHAAFGVCLILAGFATAVVNAESQSLPPLSAANFEWSLSGQNAKISLLAPMGRRVFHLQLPLRKLQASTSATRYYINYFTPSGHHAEAVPAALLNRSDYLSLALPQHRLSALGLHSGQLLTVTLTREHPALELNSPHLAAAPLPMIWDIAAGRLNDVVTRNLHTVALDTIAVAPLRSPLRLVSQNQPAPVPPEPAAGPSITATPAAGADADAAARIVTAIQSLPGLHNDRVTVTVRGNEVELRGTVGSDALRTAILNAARVTPQTEINDLLEIVAATAVSPATPAATPGCLPACVPCCQPCVQPVSCYDPCGCAPARRFRRCWTSCP